MFFYIYNIFKIIFPFRPSGYTVRNFSINFVSLLLLKNVWQRLIEPWLVLSLSSNFSNIYKQYLVFLNILSGICSTHNLQEIDIFFPQITDFCVANLTLSCWAASFAHSIKQFKHVTQYIILDALQLHNTFHSLFNNKLYVCNGINVSINGFKERFC